MQTRSKYKKLPQNIDTDECFFKEMATIECFNMQDSINQILTNMNNDACMQYHTKNISDSYHVYSDLRFTGAEWTSKILDYLEKRDDSKSKSI